MKPWQLTRRTRVLSEKLKAIPCEGIRIDFSSFPDEERLLIQKACELKETDFSPSLPKEIVDENHKLLCKFFEVIARRVVDLFVDVIPNSLCCDELERWLFKLYFYNFLADFTESYKRLRERPEADREELLKFVKEGGTEWFFRFPRCLATEDSDQKEDGAKVEDNEHYDGV